MLSGIILAGGRSTRMGTPKALLPFGGEPLVARLVARIRPLFDEVIVAASPGQELPPLDARVVLDDVAHEGPVGGMLYALRAAGGEYGFVTSCDAAFLRPELVSHLVAQRAGWDIVAPRWGGRLQPLVAVYSKAVIPLLEAQLAAGRLRLGDLLDSARTRTVDEEEIRRFDPEGASFFNMNTPEDYEEALRRLRSGATRTGSP